MVKQAFIVREFPVAAKAEESLEGEFISARDTVAALPVGNQESLEDRIISTIEPVVVTGVAKYIAKNTSSEIAVETPVLTGVARYIAGQATDAAESPVLSGVERYLRRQGWKDHIEFYLFPGCVTASFHSKGKGGDMLNVAASLKN